MIRQIINFQKSVCAVVILLFTQHIQAVESFKILSMNVFMLPMPAKFSLQKERTDVLIEHFEKTNYDILFLQEAFTESFRNQLAGKLKDTYSHNYYLNKDGKFFSFLGSGLMVMSSTSAVALIV